MKKLISTLFLSIVSLNYFNYVNADTTEFTLLEKTKIKMVTKADGSKILKTKDPFINNLSKFDMEARQKTKLAKNKISYLNFLANESLEWNPDEIQKLKSVFDSISEKIKKYNLNLPKSINLVKTTGKEEGMTEYTRGSSIMIPKNLIEQTMGKQASLERVMLHQLFHIYSRYNETKREKLYNLIGYHKCPELEYPNELKTLKITNPDGYQNNHYIKILADGKEKKVVPLIFAREQYNIKDGKIFFNYMQFKLLEVNITKKTTKPIYKGNKISFFAADESYFKQVGENTNYIIHPDEILADNFALLMNKVSNMKSKFVVDGIEKILME